MKNIDLVQSFQPLNNLNEDPPHILFFKISLLFLMPRDLLKQVTVVCVFHYDTRTELKSKVTYHREDEASSMKAS